jgi:ketosteroid isomerase-like protein
MRRGDGGSRSQGADQSFPEQDPQFGTVDTTVLEPAQDRALDEEDPALKGRLQLWRTSRRDRCSIPMLHALEHHLEESLPTGVELRRDLRVAAAAAPKDRCVSTRVLLDIVQKSVEASLKLIRRSLGRVEGKALAKLLSSPREGRQDEVLLGRKVVIEQAPGNPCSLRDLLNRHFMGPASVEQLNARAKQVLATRIRAHPRGWTIDHRVPRYTLNQRSIAVRTQKILLNLRSTTEEEPGKAVSSAGPLSPFHVFTSALGRGDLESAAACFTREGCLITPDGTVIHGRAEIGEILSQMAARGTVIEADQLVLRVGGDVGLVSGRFTLRSDGPGGARLVQNCIPAAAVRLIEGTWKIAVLAPWSDGRIPA